MKTGSAVAAKVGIMMKVALIFGGILMGMHVLGSMVFFGYTSGLPGVLAAPLLGLLGWYLVVPELIGLMVQYLVCKAGCKAWLMMSLSALVGGACAALLVPKEQGREREYVTAGFLAGVGAAVFSGSCVLAIKSRVRRGDEVLATEG